MSERYSILNLARAQETHQAAGSTREDPAGQPLSAAPRGLVSCPDCQHQCSSYAETCPQCGRFFRFYSRAFEVTPGMGWSIAVGWGVILGWIFAGLIIAALIIGLLVLAALGAASSLTQPRTPVELPRRKN